MTAVDDFINEPGIDAFAPDALVHDNGREFRGAAAIGRWLDEELHAVNATMRVREREEVHGIEVVTAAVDGTFDKTGLPDPLVLTYYFRSSGPKIGALLIVRNEQRHDA
jgi:hypothetical protein